MNLESTCNADYKIQYFFKIGQEMKRCQGMVGILS